jgi:hypothetical protein
MPVAMPMPAPHRGTAIGTWLRLKRRRFGTDLKPQAAHHRIQHMIMQPAESAGLDLQRDMPIAKVIGRTRQQQRVIHLSAGDRLGGSLNPDHCRLLVLARQQIAIAQDLTARQQEADRAAIGKLSAKPRARALLVGQGQQQGRRTTDPGG